MWPTSTDTKTVATVVVVGAGAAGMAAAIAAARAGANVKLIDTAVGPGGTVARALIHTLGGIFDDQHRIINKGLVEELVQRLQKATSHTQLRRIGKTTCLSVCPAVYHTVVANWLDEELAIEKLYQTCILELDSSGERVTGITAEKQGVARQMEVTALIDTTGTAEIIRLLDPSCLHDDEDRAAGGLICRLRDVEPGALAFPKGVSLVNELRGAGRRGELPVSVAHAWLDKGICDDEVYLKLFVPLVRQWRAPGHLAKVEARARAERTEVLNFLRRFPDFSRAGIVETGMLGIRDGGRVRGEYSLTSDDVRSGRRFEDAACRCNWPIEYWHPQRGLQLEYLGDGEYEIPLRALRLRGHPNVWTAGKCLSADHQAQSSARVVGQCWAMGEAAGHAAASC